LKFSLLGSSDETKNLPEPLCIGDGFNDCLWTKKSATNGCSYAASHPHSSDSTASHHYPANTNSCPNSSSFTRASEDPQAKTSSSSTIPADNFSFT
jgi:hypothetical protein